MDKINWFPGHMKISLEKISNEIINLDFFIEVVDARAPNISSNKELLSIFKNKTKITIALKADISDYNYHKNKSVLFSSCLSNKNKKIIIDKIYESCFKKIEAFKKKGYSNPKLYGIVVGLPNIGKSSLINFLANKTIAVSKNVVCATRKQQWCKINEQIFILDTPGVFMKNIEDLENGYKLILLGCLNHNIVNKYNVLKFAYQYFMKFYQKQFLLLFKLDNSEILKDFDDFLNKFCWKYNFINSSQIIDIERFYFYFINLLNSKNISLKFNFELDSNK